jgi:hypothetical protein
LVVRLRVGVVVVDRVVVDFLVAMQKLYHQIA